MESVKAEFLMQYQCPGCKVTHTAYPYHEHTCHNCKTTYKIDLSDDVSEVLPFIPELNKPNPRKTPDGQRQV